MNYFAYCFTIHDAKKRFRELSHIHHPDKGGDSKTMAELIRQYDNFAPSIQPHNNAFGSSSFNFNRSKPKFTYQTPPNYTSGGIPWDHPLYVELRELRAKFNYAMDEDNRILKRDNDIFRKDILHMANQILTYQDKVKRYQKIIKDLKGVTTEEKPKPKSLRKRKSAKT
jgi:hypothetical protein